MGASESSADIQVLRELARRYVEVCARPVQAERRDLWRRLNSLQHTRPLLYLRGGDMWDEIPEVVTPRCQDAFFRPYERYLRQQIYQDTFGDDFIFEPWITVAATCRLSGWGVEAVRHRPADVKGAMGAWKAEYPIREPEDFARLRPPRHEIDEAATARDAARLGDAIGDILTVNVDRGPAWRMWSADLSSSLGLLRGIEHFMLDMMDRPAWLHELMAFMRDGVLRAHDQAEAAGDWGLCDHQNQAMPYALELPDPAANANGVRRANLWCFMAAQEFTLVSPAMHEEFLLQYQRPILEKFGLTAYGCCEDLTRKIGMLRTVPNLRRIGVAPRADVRRCAEQIGGDYVISYRPNPAEMVCCGFDPARVRAHMRRDLEACRGLCVDITLKDITTVEHQPHRLRQWTQIARELAEEVA
jgi:hypothetical protein